MINFRNFLEKYTLRNVYIKTKNGKIHLHNLALFGNYKQTVENICALNSDDIEVGIIRINSYGEKIKSDTYLFFDKKKHLEVPVNIYLKLMNVDKLQKQNPENSYIENLFITATKYLNDEIEIKI